MKYTHFSSLLFIILLIIFNGCKKNSSSKPSRPSIKFSSNALEYVKLSQGKYLIYKDSATSSLDSVIVTVSNLQTVFVPEYTVNFARIADHNREEFSLILSKFVGSTQTEWFNGKAIPNELFLTQNSDIADVDLREPDNTPVFFMSHTQQSNLSLTIEGKTYNNVVIKENDNGLPISDPFYKHTIYYWAKGVGIIKRTVIKTGGDIKTYTLLRNN